jgi:Luciferase-like monooxygenase
MRSASVAGAARQSLGAVGVYLPIPFTSTPPVSLQGEAVARLERAGYRTAWVNETVGGRDPLVQLALLLPAAGRMTFGTGVANTWARAPQTAHGAAAMLAEAYPAGWCSAWASATRSRRPRSAGSGPVRWPRCGTTWSGWPPRR